LGGSSLHHQEFFTLRTVMVCVIQVCWQLASRIRTAILILLASCVTYTIAVCTVKNSWWWTEELCETYRILYQNKFEKLVHLVGFIIRIYHDARSPERQKQFLFAWKTCIYIESAFRIEPQRQPDETKQRDKKLCFFSIHNPNYLHTEVLQLVTVSVLAMPRRTKTTLWEIILKHPMKCCGISMPFIDTRLYRCHI